MHCIASSYYNDHLRKRVYYKWWRLTYPDCDNRESGTDTFGEKNDKRQSDIRCNIRFLK
jgi:hypothetical protein